MSAQRKAGKSGKSLLHKTVDGNISCWCITYLHTYNTKSCNYRKEIWKILEMGNICKNIHKKSHGRFNVLPDEIVLEIFMYLSIKDLAKCAKVSKRFRSICYSESLWCKINACMKIIPVRFLSHILSNGCQYLNLQWALIDGPQGNLPYLNYLTGPNFNSENAIDSSFNVTKVCNQQNT